MLPSLLSHDFAHQSLGLAWAWAAKKKPKVDVSEHLELATYSIWLTLGLLVLFFVLRPRVWSRLFFSWEDPRPAALLRIGFGLTILLTFVDLYLLVGEFLFTEEGLWLPELARKTYGGKLKTLWDPVHGFEHWYDPLKAMWGKFSLLHMRADRGFVDLVFASLFVSTTCVIVGFKTRIATFVTWFLTMQLYAYNPIFYTGGDTVLRCFLFLALFVRWGEAYSVDAWRRRKKAVLGGAEGFPALRRIPAWPLRLMMVQLTVIYCATGLLKSGSTWRNGSALYYALNLDHFYRVPAQELVTTMHFVGVLPLVTKLVHWWEILFPLALLGAVLRAYERDVAMQRWPVAPAWRRYASWFVALAAWGCACVLLGLGAYYYGRPLGELPFADPKVALAVSVGGGMFLAGPVAVVLYAYVLRRFGWSRELLLNWVLGKRFWLGVGAAMHIGIDLMMNVGTFVQVMLSVYPGWFVAREIDGFWRMLLWPPRTSVRVAARRVWTQARWGRVPRPLYGLFLLGQESVRFVAERQAPRTDRVLCSPGDAPARRRSLLRAWDLGHRLEFDVISDLPGSAPLTVVTPQGRRLQGAEAGRRLTALLPGLWWLWPLRWVPGAGQLALRLTAQSQ